MTSGGLSPVLREWDVCRQTLHLTAGCGARDQGLGPGAARHVRGREEEARHPRTPWIRVPAQVRRQRTFAKFHSSRRRPKIRRFGNDLQ